MVPAEGEAEPWASVHVLVSGQVQGVYFRSFVQQHALGLGLAGAVRNLPDGATVEVWAEGTREALERLERLLRRGPSRARVERVRVAWGPFEGRWQGFHILP